MTIGQFHTEFVWQHFNEELRKKEEEEGQELSRRVLRGQHLGRRPDCYVRGFTTTLSKVLGVEVRVIQEMSKGLSRSSDCGSLLRLFQLLRL